MHKTSLLLTFIILITAAAAHADGVRLTFEHPIQLAIPGVDALGKAETIDAGKEIVIEAENTYWISAKGKVPLLVVPINVKAKNTITNFHMPDVATWPSQLVERELDMKMSMMIDRFVDFQVALVAKDTQKAEKLLVEMENIKSLEYFNFLRASLNFVKGDLNAAKDSVRKGLQRYPANEQGKSLLKTIEEQKP